MSHKVQLTKQATVRTTTLRIDPPKRFDPLEAQYQLVRYVIPNAMLYMKDKYKFARLHNQLKEQLNVPYRSYTYDWLDGQRRWAIYALCPRTKDGNFKITGVIIDNDILPASVIAFHQIKHHVLLKLLQVAYFSRPDGERNGRFVGQDKCFVFAKRKNNRTYICLEMELKGDLQDEHVFYIYSHARQFVKVRKIDEHYIHLHTYYAEELHGTDMIFFRQVKRSVVKGNPKMTVYEPRVFPGQRAALDFHDIDAIETSRGYLVDVFMAGFITYLSSHGFQVQHIQRDFQKHPLGDTENWSLPVQQLGTVHIYDVRHNRTSNLQGLIARLQPYAEGVVFTEVETLDPESPVPTLIIQDTEKKAYQEESPLAGETDPHEQIYQEFPSLPKQFVNANGNDLLEGVAREDYLDYTPEWPNGHKAKMLMTQLFLKTLVLQGRDVRGLLPLLVTDLMFVHAENRGRGKYKQHYEVATYFDGQRLCFLNLDNEVDQTTFDDRVEQWGVQWDESCEAMAKRHKKENNEELTGYDVIIGPGVFVAIEDAHEAVLYDYEEIIRRDDEYRRAWPVDALKLSHRYDEIVEDQDLSADYLLMKEYVQPDDRRRQPKTKREREAVDLYFGLQDYDTFLEGLKPSHPSITFGVLTRTEAYMSEISAILGKTGRELRYLYKRIDMFQGLREEEVVPTYSGIWYNPDDLRFIVGDTKAMNTVQARAHRVRRFVVYQGAGKFQIKPLLDLMGVTFVRLNQYTVKPYAFNLLDLYIDNVLAYQYSENEEDTSEE